MIHCDVAIIGAGLAGLCCARELQAEGVECSIFEASDSIGGRVQTDRVDGFLLDRGFQVLLTAYPECRRVLDYRRLRLQTFVPGAIVRAGGEFHRVADPFREPVAAVRSLANPIGTLGDKLRVLRLVRRATSGVLAELFHRPESTTQDALVELGFSPSFIDLFFRPFLGGVFLGRDLSTSSRMLDFVIRMMALGDTAVPASGMGAIPEQIAAQLATGTVRLHSPVREIGARTIVLATGERVSARAVVVATDGVAAARLTGGRVEEPGSRGVTCVYFAADRPPVRGPWLVLNGDERGPINNMHVANEVAPRYAPPGASLVSVSVLGAPVRGDDELLESVRQQLARWFGTRANRWQHLRTYRIPHAQPEQRPGMRIGEGRLQMPRPGHFVCGDHRESASIHGAMKSGRRAARAVIQHFASHGSGRTSRSLEVAR